MKIVIEAIPHHEHRYPTVGDYWIDSDGSMQIRVSQMRDPRMELLVALHELVEFALCEEAGIPEPDIKAFDEAHLAEDEPGALPEAPYHRQHVFAEGIERLVATELGVTWGVYDEEIERLFD